VSGLVVDTSIWVEFFRGSPLPALEDSLRAGLVVLAPIVAAELLSAPLRAQERNKLTAFLRDLPLHDTPLEHWQRVGLLRSTLARKGLAVSTPDAHVGQCALDLHAPLWSRDPVFERIAGHTALRLFTG
jgi:predicted nucleic acid-binding protein